MRNGADWSLFCRIGLQVEVVGGLITAWSSMGCSGGPGVGCRGGMFHRSMAIGRPSITGIVAGQLMARGRGCLMSCAVAPTWPRGMGGRSESTPVWFGLTSMPLVLVTSRRLMCSWRSLRPLSWTRGAGSNDKKSTAKPSREALGRSRGGLTCKIHLAADRRCRPISRVTSAGHRHDSLAFEPVMAGIRIRRRGRGRPRTRPARVLGDKAFSNRAIRSHLRRRRIRATIPEPDDQKNNRLRRGRKGGRPPAFDAEFYKQRNVVERAINKLKGHRAVATRYDKRDYMFRGTIDVASIRIWLRDPVP